MTEADVRGTRAVLGAPDPRRVLGEPESDRAGAADPLSEFVEAIDPALLDAVRCASPQLEEVVSHLIRAGGKRLRPRLVVASAVAVSGSSAVDPRVVSAAVAIELLHIGSLYHDDVMDSAPSKRGVESVNQRWGNVIAILAGDLMISRSSILGLNLGAAHARVLSEALESMCAGQAAELFALYDPGRTVDAYFTAIHGKTAALTAAACGLGGLEAGASAAVLEQLRSFGHSYGVAFQLLDDLLDLGGDEQALGKRTGTDLREGVYTLPVLLALEDDRSLIEWLGRALDDVEVAEAGAAFCSSGGFTRCVARAREEADRALDVLCHLPGRRNLGHECLEGIVLRVVDEIGRLGG
jgi:heptaprenyl diphosphate synthase